MIVAVMLLIAGCEKKQSAPQVPAATAKPQAADPPPIEQVEARVMHIVAEQFGVNRTELTPNTRLKQDLKADDLDQIELVMELEDVFNISISDADAEKLQKVGQVVDYVKSVPRGATTTTQSASP